MGAYTVRPGIPVLGARPWRRPVRRARSWHRRAIFSVVELATGGLAGEAVLWAVDLHNRSAHVGISLRPAFRGRGFGVDVVRILCRYGFQVRGLRRLQLETLADNHAMMAVAEKLGFTREGMTRGSSWVNGRFCDDVIFGLLADEFTG